ncbi:MAG: 7-cyano-7-deazaguanine synthase [Thioalkalivibrio sp.]|nr:7-cyano-7-deazaguanine synthase [Thioalkalivibrio sp.]
MGGAGKTPEYRVRCLRAHTRSGGDEDLRFSIDDTQVGVSLRVGQLSRSLVARLPDRALDLLELAALIYGVDAAVSRGGPADSRMGALWHRRFLVEIPVRDLAFWQDAEVVHALQETLMFLSGDRFAFSFTPKTEPEAEYTRYFDFGEDGGWRADRVLMFSGGLDSFAGALEEVAEQGAQVALISHASSSKIAPVQRSLNAALTGRFGADACRHVPVRIQMKGRSTKEGTHRTRSFLFAALGTITAHAFARDRVSFHENGVVSLNLPPVGNVLGTRATRTTHPQALARFTDFFSRAFGGAMRVDNPYFWRTKTDVVQTVARLGMAPQIAHTRSCADVHNQTKQFVHCGRCSQCIDRRFAILAAGLEHADPAEAYKVDLLEGIRTDVRDREIGLSYMRNSDAFMHMALGDLERAFPTVVDAVGHLGHPPETGLAMITELLRRHGSSVMSVVQDHMRKKPASEYPDGSLPRLFGDAQRDRSLPHVEIEPPIPSSQEPQRTILEVVPARERVEIDGIVELRKTAAARLLIVLANEWLKGAGAGLDPLDFPCMSADRLASALDYSGEDMVRQAVKRARTDLRKKFISAGRNGAQGEDLIENIPWHGYRLAPDRVQVRLVQEG